MNILGIDVSKAKLDCYLSQGIEAKAKPRYQFQINNDEAGFEQLRKEIARKGFQLELLTVVLEPTSVYHQPLAYWLRYSNQGGVLNSFFVISILCFIDC